MIEVLYFTFLYYLIVNKYSAAILADYNFLSRFDVELPLGRYLVETPSACITLNRYYSKPVPCI